MQVKPAGSGAAGRKPYVSTDRLVEKMAMSNTKVTAGLVL